MILPSSGPAPGSPRSIACYIITGATIPAGCSPAIGIAGLALGGGLGVLGRAYGLVHCSRLQRSEFHRESLPTALTAALIEAVTAAGPRPSP